MTGCVYAMSNTSRIKVVLILFVTYIVMNISVMHFNDKELVERNINTCGKIKFVIHFSSGYDGRLFSPLYTNRKSLFYSEFREVSVSTFC
jgi:hypothetical protein